MSPEPGFQNKLNSKVEGRRSRDEGRTTFAKVEQQFLARNFWLFKYFFNIGTTYEGRSTFAPRPSSLDLRNFSNLIFLETGLCKQFDSIESLRSWGRKFATESSCHSPSRTPDQGLRRGAARGSVACRGPTAVIIEFLCESTFSYSSSGSCRSSTSLRASPRRLRDPTDFTPPPSPRGRRTTSLGLNGLANRR